MYKEIITLADLQSAFENIDNDSLDYWADAFWTLYSHGHKLLAKF